MCELGFLINKSQAVYLINPFIFIKSNKDRKDKFFWSENRDEFLNAYFCIIDNHNKIKYG